MIQSLQKTINILDEVRKLNFSTDHFMVVGSGIMAVKGIRDAYDLDIVVSTELFEICKTNGWELMPWTRTGRPGKAWLKKGIVDLMLEITCGNEDFDLEALQKGGEKIDGMWFMSLAQLIKFKKEYGRPKDFEDIAMMEKFMKENGQAPQK